MLGHEQLLELANALLNLVALVVIKQLFDTITAIRADQRRDQE